jgi:murein DD-endopeptidase MepM/ murein hydrolase activator NlpD
MAELEPAPLTRRELRAREAAALAAAEAAAAASVPASRRERRAAEAASAAATIDAAASVRTSAPVSASDDAASSAAETDVAASDDAETDVDTDALAEIAAQARPIVTVETVEASSVDLLADASPAAEDIAEDPAVQNPAIAPFLADASILDMEPVASASAVPDIAPVESTEPALAAVPVFSDPTVAPVRRSRAARRAAARPPVSTAASRPHFGKRLVAFGTLVGAAAMVVGLSIPASAFFVETPTALLAVDAPERVAAQVLDTIDTSAISAPVERDTWAMTSEAELRQASTIRRDFSYEVHNEGAVRWPFPVAVPISDGYGARVSPCSGCSSQHKGTDFTPGVGAPITSIADGVVTIKEVSSWGFGNHVFIEHVINGQKVTTLYAHMQEGSSALKVGDVVEAGQFVGLVGATGAATGPHLHLEIRLDGVVQVDPFAWLKANAS